MKYSGLLCILVLFSFSLSAQSRYQTAVFAEYDSIINIKYGNNLAANDSIERDLTLDIYMPKGDTLTQRPVIFFTHGGSFLSGTKEDGDVTHFCRYFARHGYVTVSQNYRLGFESFDGTGAKRAVWRAIQDGRAAVRFMRSKAGEYSLDTNMFIYGGSSAGGFVALQLAFYDKPSELLEGTDTLELGGFEGNTNHLTNSSKVQAVINLCGAIGDTSWIEPTDSIPLMSMHGNKDAIVPYGSNTIYLLGFIPLLEVDGSASIRERENNLNFHNRFYTYCGTDHVPYAYNSPVGRQAMDTTLALINQFLYEDVLKLGIADVRVEDVDSVDCPGITGIRNLALMNDIKIYPNPVSDRIFIESPASYQRLEVEILDASGKKIYASHFKPDQINSIDIQPFKSGVYLLIIRSDEKVSLKKMVKK